MAQADYKKESVSLIVTIFNEAQTLPDFLQSLAQQSRLPEELVICDAASEDKSQQIVRDFAKKAPFPVELIVKASTRSVGRNLAAKKAKGQWLAITDAGTIVDRDWLKELLKKAAAKKVPLVAGYYRAQSETKLQAAIAPYFMVTPNRLDETKFLPATRSMLIKKSLWEEVGGMDESLDYAEDYPLAKKLEAKGVKMAFAKEAIVNWLPPKTIESFFKTILATAQYDVIAKVIRPKIYLVFARYLIFLLILLFFGNFYLIFLLIMLYFLWSIAKNYLNCKQAWFYLPLLQVLADLAVMLGSLLGLIQTRQQA